MARRSWILPQSTADRKWIGRALQPATSTVSATLASGSRVEAFHFRLEQTRLFGCGDGDVPGRAGRSSERVGDLFGRRIPLRRNVHPLQILIGHGYSVIGGDPAMLVYVTNKFYNPKDEGRIARRTSDTTGNYSIAVPVFDTSFKKQEKNNSLKSGIDQLDRGANYSTQGSRDQSRSVDSVAMSGSLVDPGR